MMTQYQGFGITSMNELVVSPSLFDEFMNDAEAIEHPIGALYTSSVRILRHAFWLAKQKATLTRKEYKELLRKLGWQGEEKRYLKLDAAFNIFSPHELAQVEPRTLFQIAENLNKYGSVITQMKNLAQITQDAVRTFIKQCRKPKAKKEEEAPTIWRMAPDGQRVCQIAPIYNQSVGVMLQTMMDTEGLTAQAIVEEALLARFELKYGSSVENVENSVTSKSVAEIIETAAPLDGNVETAPSFEQCEITSWDEDQVVMETENTGYNQMWDEELEIQGIWSFEPEEKENSIEDYEFLTVVNIQSETLAPVDSLVQVLQTASSWEEISEALKTHEECKQEAWDALTPMERRRVIELTPPTITRLNSAKREGLIADWKESRPGVYQVKYNGCLFWEIVYESRVEQFFAQLYNLERA